MTPDRRLIDAGEAWLFGLTYGHLLHLGADVHLSPLRPNVIHIAIPLGNGAEALLALQLTKEPTSDATEAPDRR